MAGVSFNINDDSNGTTFIINSDDTVKDSTVAIQQYSDTNGFVTDEGSINITYAVLREIYWTLRNQGFPG